ncbi:MAG: hypothetical protein NZ605_08870, partial [Acidimicrobiales bacterium]|nr:hypothetical protein [Acidimicrobiales bacterium]
ADFLMPSPTIVPGLSRRGRPLPLDWAILRDKNPTRARSGFDLDSIGPDLGSIWIRWAPSGFDGPDLDSIWIGLVRSGFDWVRSGYDLGSTYNWAQN